MYRYMLLNRFGLCEVWGRDYSTFFERATLNPNAHLITGVICGYRVEEIENPITRQARYMDKLIDELAKGRKMEKILRG
jgi:hypothetical protein